MVEFTAANGSAQSPIHSLLSFCLKVTRPAYWTSGTSLDAAGDIRGGQPDFASSAQAFGIGSLEAYLSCSRHFTLANDDFLAKILCSQASLSCCLILKLGLNQCLN